MIIVGVLLLVEYFLFSVSFDFIDLRIINSPLRVLGYLGAVAPLAMIIATAMVVLAGSRFRNEFLIITAHSSYKKNIVLWIIHILAYCVLMIITNRIFSSELFLILWTICALLAGGSALFLALPQGFLRQLFIRNRWVLVIAIGTGFLAWITALWSHILWNSIGSYTFIIVGKLVTFLPGTAIVIPEDKIVGTTQFSVKISSSCSGYQGIGMIAVFIAVYLIFKRKELRFPAALIFWPLAVVLAWLANAFRIFVLIAIGASGFEEIALGGFMQKRDGCSFVCLHLEL